MYAIRSYYVAIFTFKDGQQRFQEPVELLRGADVDFAAEMVLDIAAITLANAENDPGYFGKIPEEIFEQFDEKAIDASLIPKELAFQPWGEGQHIHGQIDCQPLLPEQGRITSYNVCYTKLLRPGYGLSPGTGCPNSPVPYCFRSAVPHRLRNNFV